MTKQRGLGRGLAELIPAAAPLQAGERVEEINLELIDPNPFQPRRDFDPEELQELAASIRAQGLLQPITLRRSGARFQVVMGERRLRATRDLGWTTIRAIVREVDDRGLHELSLVENILRSDLNEIEIAQQYRRLEEIYSYTATQLSEVTGKSRPAISNTLRLLELPDDVQEMIRQRQLTAGHGRAVLSFPTPQREDVAQQCAQQGWSVRELERRSIAASQRTPVRRARRSEKTIPSAPPALRRFETQLQEHLGTRVRINEQAGHGTVSISYHGAQDLERLLGLLLRHISPL
jgi:ParB family transcriptional regulator, chromosome partitioning protein